MFNLPKCRYSYDSEALEDMRAIYTMTEKEWTWEKRKKQLLDMLCDPSTNPSQWTDDLDIEDLALLLKEQMEGCVVEKLFIQKNICREMAEEIRNEIDNEIIEAMTHASRAADV